MRFFEAAPLPTSAVTCSHGQLKKFGSPDSHFHLPRKALTNKGRREWRPPITSPPPYLSLTLALICGITLRKHLQICTNTHTHTQTLLWKSTKPSKKIWPLCLIYLYNCAGTLKYTTPLVKIQLTEYELTKLILALLLCPFLLSPPFPLLFNHLWHLNL